MPKDVIIACDFPSAQATLDFLQRLGQERPYLKIGMELFYAEGADMVRRLKARGHRIFLDLKLHDIPNTVASAMRVLAGLGADMLNVHAAGGIAMMRAAAQALAESGGERPQLIAVTQLTSTSPQALQEELLIEAGMEETVLHYARNAQLAGLDGIVCSPLEVEKVHQTLGAGFVTVAPGVRFESQGTQDQQRVATPQLARRLGAEYIVVGRPITRSDDPLTAYRRCVDAFIG